MTTATRPTRQEQEPKVCGQTFAVLASLGITVHFAHEILSGAPTAEVVAGAVMVGATLAVAAGWYRLGARTRRTLAAVLGFLWAAAASEHLYHLSVERTALDLTGLLTFVGGLTLAFAAYWDYSRPLERSL